MSSTTIHLPPGFRFHPTDEELILHYLRNRASSSPCPVSIIAEVDIYKFDPWKLPVMASFGDREWYFFSPRDRKYPNGIRPNRAAASGYWKATGTDKPISSGNENIGVKKALVFYTGRPPKGVKTNWIMHEYRLVDAHNINCYKPSRIRDHSMRLDDWVLCRIYMKSNQLLSPTTDQEPEDPCVQMLQNDRAKLQKASSMAEFIDDYSTLSNIFDTQPELPRFDSSSFSNHQLLCNGYLLPDLSPAESPPSIGVQLSLRKHSDLNKFANISSQFDSSQYGLLSQPFLNHQLLMNSHIGRI